MWKRVIPQRVLSNCLLTFVIVATVTLGRGMVGASTTFHSTQSYAVYPQWVASTAGRCEFSFRTSRENGILLYIDGNGETPQTYLLLKLRHGSIAVDFHVGSPEADPMQASLGEHLNDNNLQKVTIVHHSHKFDFQLNDTSVAALHYDSLLVFGTRSHSFFGGIPPTHTPDLNVQEDSFIGCLEDIMFANDTSDAFGLLPRPPFETSDVTIGCEDPCDASGGPCMNDGLCLSLWEGEGRALCDCRETWPLSVGQFCNEDISNHRLHFTGDKYFCYNVQANEPYTGEPVTASVRIVPPLPSHGTIITGHTSLDSPVNGYFEVHLKDLKIVMELWANDSLIVQFALENALAPNVKYQLDLLQESSYIELNINGVGQKSKNLQNPIELVFNEICIGGVQLEVPFYVGIMEYVFFKHFALAENHTFELLNQSVIEKSNVINLLDINSTPIPSLIFNTVSFGHWDLSFEIRGVSMVSGALVSVIADNSSELSLFYFDSMLLVVSYPTISVLCGMIVDSDWHQVTLDAVHTGEIFQGLTISVDGIQTCNMTNSTFQNHLKLFVGAPIEIGRVNEDSIFGATQKFVGCLGNVEFQRNSDSEVFIPNLEAATKHEERFDTSDCYYCSSDMTESTCLNGGHCLFHIGYEDVVCSCPGGFFGKSCESTTPPTVSTSTDPLPTSSLGILETPIDNVQETDDNEQDPLEIGMWVSLGVGTVLILILAGIIAVMAYLIYQRTTSRGRGFYRTQESDATTPQYSASLQKVTSHTVASNGHVPIVKNQNREREFFI